MKKKILLSLAAALVLALCCGAALAAISGGPLSDGGEVWYEDDYSGTVRIGGTGATSDFGSSDNFSPLDGNGMQAAVVEAGVTGIGSNVFINCPNLTSVTIMNPDAVISGTAIRFCGSDITIRGWENSTAAAYAQTNGYEFESLGSLTGSCGDSVTWSFDPATGTLTLSGTGAMYDYSTTQSQPWHPFRDSVVRVIIQSGVTQLGYGAFFRLEQMESVTIPNTVNRIGDSAFSRCESLTGVMIPDSVTWIGVGAFTSCKSLTEIRIPENVTQIQSYTFSYCSNLASVTISAGVTAIYGNAFADCTGLQSITIPANVTEIRGYVFYGCSSLTSAAILNPNVTFGTAVFNDCPSLTLRGWEGSTAAQYAVANDLDFRAFATSGSCGTNLTWLFSSAKLRRRKS